MDLKPLIDAGERPTVEFKSACSWEGEERVRLTKAIAAMANSRDGGVVIVGIHDDRTDGKPKLAGLSPEQLKTFDPTPILKFVNERFAPDISLRVEKQQVKGHNLAALVVVEFQDQPHVCVRDMPYNGKLLIKAGDVLVRTAACESKVVGPDEMRDLLGRGVQKKGEHLLEQVRQIVRGVPPVAPEVDWREAYRTELSAANGHANIFFNNSKHGGWHLQVIPLTRLDAPLSHPILEKAVQQATVSLRGWNLPATSKTGTQNFIDRVTSELAFEEFRERWDCYRSRVFCDLRSFWEDTAPFRTTEPGRTLSMLSVVYTLAEFVLFAKRFLGEVGYEGDLVLRCELVGCQGRVITNATIWHENYRCLEPRVPVVVSVHTTELAAGWEQVAVDMAQEVFRLFNWNNSDAGMLRAHIAKLVNRQA